MSEKKDWILIWLFVCFVVTALFPTWATGESADLKLTKIQNEVMVKTSKSTTWKKAVLNMALVKGDKVRTGKNSFATLTFSYPGENCFQLYENTEIAVSELMKGEKG